MTKIVYKIKYIVKSLGSLKFDVICSRFISGCERRVVMYKSGEKLGFGLSVRVRASCHSGVPVTALFTVYFVSYTQVTA